jgi:hypothetical protein
MAASLQLVKGSPEKGLKRGTSAPRRGRPPIIHREIGRSVKVYLLPSVIEQAKSLGAGNLSQGIACAVARASGTDK